MNQSKEINSYMNELGSGAKEASKILSQSSLEQRNDALMHISAQIESQREEILRVNKEDLTRAREKSLSLIHI